MPSNAFIHAVSVSVPANGTATAVFTVSAGETFEVHFVLQTNSNANLSITNIRDQKGRSYLLAGAANALPVQQVGNAFGNANELNALDFVEPIVIEPNGTLFFDFQNVSAGVLVIVLILVGRKLF